MSKRTISSAVVLSVILLLGACSKASTTAEPNGASATAAESGDSEDGAVRIVARDNSYEIPEISAGTHQFVLKNEGTQAHMALIVHLLDGKSIEEAIPDIKTVLRTDSEPPKWQEPLGSGSADPGATAPIAEGAPKPGATMYLEAGDYIVLCMLPEGMTSLDAVPPKGGESLAELGMIQGFTVT